MKTLLLALIVLFTFHSNAQWYTKQFGVNDIHDLNKEQLNVALTKAEKTTKTGAALTLIGLPVFIVGSVISYSGMKEFTELDIDQGVNKLASGSLMMCAGVLSAGIGIPLWIVGNNRKDIITFQLLKFKGTSYIPSLGIKINF